MATSLDMLADRTPRARGGLSLGNHMQGLTYLVLFFFASNPNVLLFGGRGGDGSQNDDTSSLFYILSLACYLLTTIAILARLRTRFTILFRAVPVWLLVAYAFASIAWSIEPAHTASRSAALLGTTLAAALLATFSAQQQFRIMAYCFAAVLVASLALVVIAPSFALADYGGVTVVRGMFVHKNIYGWSSALFGIIAFGATQSRAIPKGWGYGIVALAFVSAVASQSASGIIALILGVGLYLVLGVFRQAGAARPMVVTAALVILFIVVGSAGVILPLILESFDKTVTLSGRTTIWTALIPAIEERFFVGWGFGGALWKSAVGRDFLKYAFFAGNAQGGYVEQMVNSGLIGCLLLFLPMIWLIKRLVARSNAGDQFAQTFVVILIILLVLGVTAPLFMPVNQIFWIVTALPFFYEALAPTRRTARGPFAPQTRLPAPNLRNF